MEVESDVYSNESMEDMVKTGLTRGTCVMCDSLGHVLCHHSLRQQRTSFSYSGGLQQDLYLGKLGCPPKGSTVKMPLHYGSGIGANAFYPNRKIAIDELVEQLEMSVVIEIEASL